MNTNQQQEPKAQDKQSESQSRRPTHIAYWLRDRGENRNADWQPIGVAWSHADGKGLSLRLDLQPLDGRITLRAVEDKHE